MNKFFFAFLLSVSLSFSSCVKDVYTKIDPVRINKDIKNGNITKDVQDIINNNCVTDRFAQGQDDNLYGRVCIEDKHLVIKTNQTGSAVATSASISPDKSKVDGLRLEKALSFINKVFDMKYEILKNKGDDKKIPFLRKFLTENERFLGSLSQKYNIIFETRGNYLVLFKASKDLNQLPYIERTSAVKTKDGKFHMVPFLGYPIEYCNPEIIKNRQGEKSREHRLNCEGNSSKSAQYIRVNMRGKKLYNYYSRGKDDKKDLFPSSYFEGEWFFSESAIETQDRDPHLPPFSSHLIKFNKTTGTLEMLDVSGDVDEKNRELEGKLLVSWLDYEMDRDGENFNTFGERTINYNDPTTRPYVVIKKPLYIHTVEKHRTERGVAYATFRYSIGDTNSEIIDFLVSDNFFSITLKITAAQK